MPSAEIRDVPSPYTDADVFVVDPPRTGLALDAVKKLSEQSSRVIAYVSCDQATLARALCCFVDAGTFRPVSVTPVDLFPQTFHVENVVLLAHKTPDSHIHVKVEFDRGKEKVLLGEIVKRVKVNKKEKFAVKITHLSDV